MWIWLKTLIPKMRVILYFYFGKRLNSARKRMNLAFKRTIVALSPPNVGPSHLRPFQDFRQLGFQ